MQCEHWVVCDLRLGVGVGRSRRGVISVGGQYVKAFNTAKDAQMNGICYLYLREVHTALQDHHIDNMAGRLYCIGQTNGTAFTMAYDSNLIEGIA